MIFRKYFSRLLRTYPPKKLLGCRGQDSRRKCSESLPCSDFSTRRNYNPKFSCNRGMLKSIVILSHKPRATRKLGPRDINLLVTPGERMAFIKGVRDSILILMRILVIGSVITALTIVYLLTRLSQPRAFPIILRKGIEFLGPSFIKLGQWISTRKDLFPEEICDTLSQLQRTAPPHSWMYTKHLLEATYGPAWRDLFVKFEGEVPVGSGCCAQVYKAWVDPNARIQAPRELGVSRFIELMEYAQLGYFVSCLGKHEKVHGTLAQLDRELCTGDYLALISDGILGGKEETQCAGLHSRKLQLVAVKILHPGIKDRLTRDLSIIKGICKFATYVAPQLQWLSLTDCIDEFSRTMENQLDMNLEAENLLKFAQNFSHKKDVVFPSPLVNLTHREILVETFHEGLPISDYVECDDAALQGRLAKIGIKTMLKMVFKDNFIHCDLHPGNILVQMSDEPVEGFFASLWRRVNGEHPVPSPRLIILDCGLVVSLNDRCRRNLRDVFRSVLLGNGELAAEYILEHSSHMTPDPDGFKSTIRDIVSSHLSGGVNLNNVNVSTVVTELFSAMVRHRVKQDGSFSSVILSMVVIEGLGRSLDPNIDIFTEVLPYVFSSTVYGN